MNVWTNAQGRLESILNDGTVPSELVLEYLSNHPNSPVYVVAMIKLLDLHIEQLSKTVAPVERDRLREAIGEEAGIIITYKDLMGTDYPVAEDVPRIRRLAVEHIMTPNDLDETPGDGDDAEEQMGVPPGVFEPLVNHIKIESALNDSNPAEAIRIAAEAGGYELLQSLYGRVPQDMWKVVEDQLWLAARQGKLPLEEALSLAKKREEKGMEAILAEAALATAKDSYQRALIASQYHVGDLGQCLLGVASELRQQTAELRKKLETNPVEVAEQLYFLGDLSRLVSDPTYPEQSQRLHDAIRAARVLETDALIRSGEFEKARYTAVLYEHPKAEWLSNLVRLANER